MPEVGRSVGKKGPAATSQSQASGYPDVPRQERVTGGGQSATWMKRLSCVFRCRSRVFLLQGEDILQLSAGEWLPEGRRNSQRTPTADVSRVSLQPTSSSRKSFWHTRLATLLELLHLWDEGLEGLEASLMLCMRSAAVAGNLPPNPPLLVPLESQGSVEAGQATGEQGWLRLGALHAWLPVGPCLHLQRVQV